MTPQQLVLSLDCRPALGREDFIVGACNAEAVRWIDAWPDWPQRALVVSGPAGSGKSHLVAVFATRSGAVVVRGATDLARARDLLLDRRPAAMAIECQGDTDEEALLHAVNAARETGTLLLITSAKTPATWRPALADLRSRLLAMPTAAIRPPDDALLAQILAKHFSDRQVAVGDEVVRFLVQRMERSFRAARDLAARLDRAALAEGRAITVQLARRVLGAPDGGPGRPDQD